ncbi:MAG: hypothetical protein PHR35_21150, partial [Kiritimatiellae bacterium]|nr:hypothetical protein [Kiritimatiellia bacterium]
IEKGVLGLSAALPLTGSRLAGEALNVNARFEGVPGSVTGSCERLVWPATNGLPWVVRGGRLQADVDLARGAKALRPVFTLPATAVLDGRAVGGVSCEAAEGVFRLRYNGALRNLHLTTTAWKIVEPDARIEGTAEAAPSAKRVSIAGLTAKSSAVACTLKDFESSPGLLAGSLAGNCDLSVLDGWRRPPREGAPTHIYGKLKLGADARSTKAGTDFNLTATCAALEIKPPKGAGWSEARAELGLTAQLDAARTQLTIKRLNVTNALLQAVCEGLVADLRGARRTTLDGKLAVDFGRVNALLRAQGIPYPTVTGFEARPFSLASPLAAGVPAVLSYGRGKAALHLSSLEAFGLRAHAADFETSLQDGVLQLSYAPGLDKGSLQTKVSLEVTGKPWILVLPKDGIVLRDIPLTDEVLRLLGRVNPLIGGCTAVSGTANIELRNGRIPLDGSYTRDTTFDAVIELRDATIMPGGTLAEILSRTGAAGKGLEIEHERLEVACRDGRLRPPPHSATIDGHTISFSGTVGLDQTVAYVVEAPLTSDLVGADAAKYLEGQTVKVVVTGTVQRPAIDLRSMSGAIKKMAAEAAKRALGEQATRLLERLREKVSE